ncbi:glycoside hydrolase family 88 protein [Paenibacillus sp.]|uniref:glycoside hydrolase family 88/105 protein n=1 Tax=Paenibacillus sp. TaxID=58172 RepID=UPI002811C7C3|nr:glycoside hydrolase family 88 protein [Paenibacillus sp.]
MTTRNPYFDPEESMARQTDGTSVEHVLTTMAQKYIGDHPMHAPVYRVSRKQPIRKAEDHRYVFPGDVLFPPGTSGRKAYAWAKLWIPEAQTFAFSITCLGPVKLYHNGAKRFGSSKDEEGAAAPPLRLPVPLTKGWNHFVLELERGAGAVFGTSNRKNFPYHFLVPSVDRDGEEGWLYTRPTDDPLPGIPAMTVLEAATGVEWLPEHDPSEEAAEAEAFGADTFEARPERLYGWRDGYAAYAWTEIDGRLVDGEPLALQGTAYGPIRVQLNGVEVLRQDRPGDFNVPIRVPAAIVDLVVRSECGSDGWGCRLTGASLAGKLRTPRRVAGAKEPWLYLGPFPAADIVDITDYQTMDALAAPEGEEPFYWRTASPAGFVRPFLENERFGKWNYPLGVTLYGLLETGKTLGRPDVLDYVAEHVEFASSRFAYSLWDRAKFGAAGINNQLSHVDSLDDCGSFGALSLLADRGIRPLKGVRETAAHIAEYVMHRQDRLEDGALYRKVGVSPSMHNTMWCDDMYMSVPFLCRYAEASGDPNYVSEAARQLLLYKKYLYMPEKKIMSHVYDVAAGKPTLTPWGRGNGWVFFSLTELLTVLPRDHDAYPDILRFYQELAEGYLALQGERGLWHQVLTDPESYPEASCTSMFLYGFARGVRNGWLAPELPYRKAALAAWEGLCEAAIDRHGNLYGVCRGSSFSFSNHYYKHELSWNLNDTHGIGIVMLAGVETMKLLEYLGSDRKKEQTIG